MRRPERTADRTRIVRTREYADEYFESSNNECVLPGANQRDFVTRREGGRFNKKTVMTFSGPVEIPGVHLKGWGSVAGGHLCIQDHWTRKSDCHIVQIFNKDETQVVATILAIPNYRLKSTDKTVVTFRERPAGEPEALRAWFYPGRNWGDEFVYPKARAIALAKETNTPVLFMAVDIPLEVAEPIKTPTSQWSYN